MELVKAGDDQTWFVIWGMLERGFDACILLTDNRI
jgi:hypothetical protein